MGSRTIISAIAAAFLAIPISVAAQEPSSETAPGEYVARAADCVSCHSVPDGKAFSGGLKMGTPLGAIYSTNITPDKATGIGDYSLADFDNAVRKGIAKDGHRLYPAMPYPSYAKLSDQDIAALYDYVMHQVPPATQINRPSEISWPLNIRWPLALWDAVFSPAKPYAAKPEHDAAWNRGAYLVHGPGHCGACHTPRGWAFQEKALDESDSKYLSGAVLDGWTAPSLRGEHDIGLGRWTEQDIIKFLKEGRNQHASVFGSMIDAYNNSTQFLTDDDLAAIARYLKSLPPAAPGGGTYAYDDSTEKALRTFDYRAPGANLYHANCAGCHGLNGAGYSEMLPSLAGNPNVLAPDPSSLINLILNGASRVVTQGVPDSYRMAAYRVSLNDQEIADLTTFIRHAWGNKGSAVDAKDVAKLRDATNMSSDRVIILKMR